jgi:hypothetical protein
MRTFCGPEENANQDSTLAPTPRHPRGRTPPLGWTLDPEKGALRAEARPVGVSSAFCRGIETLQSAEQSHARVLWSQHTKQKPVGSFTSILARMPQQLRRGSKRKRRDCR